MTRIIGGTAGGRRLRTPAGDATRPTSDRVREALFSAVESWCGPLDGLHVLDLYAGTGALGLEAWSRGAASVVLVERDRRTADLIQANARELGCQVAEVIASPVAQVLGRPPRQRYDLVLSDPPYDRSEDDVADDLALLPDQVADDALIVLERSVRSPEPRWPHAISPERSKRYGETVLWFAHPVPVDGS